MTNEVRQNPPQSKVRPVDDKADPETAEIMTGLIRHIWNNGDAVYAITNASEWQVGVGYGYFHVLTDYVDDGSLEQDIYIKPVTDPSTVYDDPAIQLPTGADRQFCFIVEDMPREDFREQYKDAKEVDFSSSGSNSWWQEDSVRVAEYWVRKHKTRTLNLYADGSTGYADEQPQPMPGMMPMQVVQSRTVEAPYVCWYKISGSEILDKRELPNKYIPIIRVVGVEKIIDGEREVKGLVRNAKDAQRMYNFWATAYAERVALSPLAPFVGPAGFAEGFENRWKASNKKTFAYLEYNVVHDDQGRPLPSPARQPGPDVPQGYVEGMMLSSDDIKSTTGQYDASLGNKSTRHRAARSWPASAKATLVLSSTSTTSQKPSSSRGRSSLTSPRRFTTRRASLASSAKTAAKSSRNWTRRCRQPNTKGRTSTARFARFTTSALAAMT